MDSRSFKTFSSLKFKNFQLYFFGNLVSQIGTQMQIVGVNWQVYELTHSPVSLGLVGLAGFLPILFFSLLGGLIADRFNRKYLLMWSQFAQAVVAAILAYTTITQTISPNLMYLLLALNATILTVNAPARQAIIPSLVPKDSLLNAVSLNTLTRQSSIVIGPLIGGFLIEYLGIQSIYIFNALSFFALIFALIPVNVPTIIRTTQVSFSLKSIMEGIRFVKNSPLISSTMLLDFFATLFSSATTLLPIFAKEILGTGVRGLGILYAAPSIGAVLAGLIISTFGQLKNQGKIILGMVIVYGLATIGFGLSRSFYLSLFFLFFVGVGDMVSTIIRNNIRQVLTPDHLKGRMISINMIFFQGGPQLGEFEAGFLAALVGAQNSVILGGVGTILAVFLVAAFVPKLRQYQATT